MAFLNWCNDFLSMNNKDNQMKKILLLSCTCLFSTLVLAENCDNARNSYDAVHCDNKVYAHADNELNKNYQELRALLNTQQKNILKSSQLAWIRDRDSSCTSDSNVGQVISTRCQLEKTQERNSWLRERIRECKTIGCKTNALN